MNIYKITNNINDKVYIGLTKNSIEERFASHCYSQSSVSLVSKAIKKYGKENFKIELLKSCSNIEELKKAEIQYIQLYESTNREFGYNIHEGGNIPPRATKKSSAKMARSRWKQVIGTNLATGEQKLYNNIKDTKLDGFNSSNVSMCCRKPGWQKYHKGWKWEFVDKSNIIDHSIREDKSKNPRHTQKHSEETLIKIRAKRKGKAVYTFPVIAINLNDSSELNFNSIKEASETLNIKRRTISNILNGWSSKTKNNYTFRYMEKN